MDKVIRGVGIILLCVSTMLGGTFLSCGAKSQTQDTVKTESNTGQPQNIYQVMEPAQVNGQSITNYVRVLSAGDEVSGNINLSGEWEVPGDSRTPWTYEAWDAAGAMIDSATIRFMPFDNENPYHYFNFVAAINGQYIIRIIHYSLLVQYLSIEISPSGWLNAEQSVFSNPSRVK